MATAECVKTYAISKIYIDDEGEVISGPAENDAGVVLDRMAKEYATDHNMSYEASLQRMMTDPRNADLVGLYGSASYQDTPGKDYVSQSAPDVPARVGEDVDRACQAYIEATGSDYETALHDVLEACPNLAARYARVVE